MAVIELNNTVEMRDLLIANKPQNKGDLMSLAEAEAKLSASQP